MSRRVSIWLASSFIWSMGAAQSFAVDHCTLRAFGDVNLGRQVGQRIIAGDTLYPFRLMRSSMSRPDVVFANLESQLTDQGGETRHPKDAYRFCGPRMAASALSRAGIDVVSCANNHAYDYGRRGLLETLSSLDEVHVRVAGLRSGSGKAEPACVVVTPTGVRIGFVAYTEFVNVPGAWSDKIAVFSRARARREIRELRAHTDIIVASYHGGSEYTARPPRGTLRNLRALAEEGADVVIGHHPHVPQGVEIYRGALICYSLGNFVFYQPQRIWTQYGLSVSLDIAGTRGSARVAGLQVVPVRAGLQPSTILSDRELDSLGARLNATSPSLLRREGSSFILSMYDHSLL